MDFVLRYRGSLPGGARNTARDKHDLRLRFHRQLQELCMREVAFQQATLEGVPTVSLKGSRMEVERPLKIDPSTGTSWLFHKVPIGGFEFVPLITRPHELACQLDILWLRREKPGDIVQGGDLDNRLKCLLDGLRMPHNENEVTRPPPNPAMKRCYCLMEDDSLITKLSVSTHQTLGPPQEGEKTSDVDLLIHITVVKTFPMWGNLSF